jgi:hypothetical protein
MYSWMASNVARAGNLDPEKLPAVGFSVAGVKKLHFGNRHSGSDVQNSPDVHAL